MKKNTILLITVVCISLLMQKPCNAVVDSTSANAGFQFLDLPPSPRQIALGYAGTALGTPGFAYYNPASAMLNNNSYVSGGYAPMPDEYTIAHAEGTYRIAGFFIGANTTNHFVDGIIPANEKGVSEGIIGSYNGTMLALNGGYISNRFACALTINGLQERIVSSTAFGISVSGGVMYLLTNKLTIGVSGLHLGTTTGYLEQEKKLGQGALLPRSARAGVAFCDTLFRMPYTLTGDVVYRDVGTYLTKYSQRATRLTVPVGLEVLPTPYVAIRVGKRLLDETNIINAGLGLKWSLMSFDLACAISRFESDIDVKPFIAVTYSVNAIKPAKQVKKASSTAPAILEKMPPASQTPQVVPVSQPVVATPLTDTASVVEHKNALSDSTIAIPDSVKVMVPLNQQMPNQVDSLQSLLPKTHEESLVPPDSIKGEKK